MMSLSHPAFPSVVLAVVATLGVFVHQGMSSLGFVVAAAILVVGLLLVRREVSRGERTAQALDEREVTLQSISDGVISTDTQGTIVRMNRAAAALAGWAPDEAIGKPFDVVFPLLDEETHAPADGPIHRALSPNGAGSAAPRVKLLRSAEHERRVADSAAPICDEAGAVRGVVVVLRDVTAERALETRFRRLLEAAPDALIISDAEGRIVMINGQATKLFGYEPGELLGRDVEHLVPVRSRERHVTHRRRYHRTPRARPMGAGLELYAQRKDGVEFPAEISLSPIELPEGVLAIAAVRDVSRRKEDEAALRDAMAAAESANRELEAFSYSVAHDLRAPLRSMDGFSHALLEDYGDALDQTGRGYLERVRASAQRMGRLIDDLLGLSRVARSELRCEVVDLSATAREVGARLSAACPDRSVAFEVEEGLTANGDPRLLTIVMENLLGNAWKFTGKRPDARVEVGAVPGSASTFFVRDNGAGFDMAYAGKLFGPFKRLHPASEFEGTGIGLATVQRVIARHGGRIWADAAPGEGATFTFTLDMESRR